MSDRPPEPGSHTTVLTRDPVRIVWVSYGFIQAVVILLTGAGIIPPVVSSIVTGVALACYVAVSELFVRKETVPLEPLLDLARSLEGEQRLTWMEEKRRIEHEPEE